MPTIYLFSLAMLIELALLETGLCQGSVEVVVTTPASLQAQIRSEIDSALSSFTCGTSGTNINNDPSTSNEELIINKINAISDKLDTLQQRLEMLHQLGSSPVHPASSCAEILQEYPNSMSGHYWVSNATGHAHSVYCDMTRSCGGVTGGWMRVAYLDMINSSHQCPSSLHQRTDSGVRSCAVKNDSGSSCSSVYYTSHGIHYSKVCGKIRGYQVETPDGFRSSVTGIDSIYMDGVSLTHGKNERHHIWTFAVRGACPCGTPPTFVGYNYFCDGEPDSLVNLGNPLWDGQGCGSNTCCTFNNPPWFYRQLSQTTSDVVEMRLCRDQGRGDEDITIDSVELYIQ